MLENLYDGRLHRIPFETQQTHRLKQARAWSSKVMFDVVQMFVLSGSCSLDLCCALMQTEATFVIVTGVYSLTEGTAFANSALILSLSLSHSCLHSPLFYSLSRLYHGCTNVRMVLRTHPSQYLWIIMTL